MPPGLAQGALCSGEGPRPRELQAAGKQAGGGGLGAQGPGSVWWDRRGPSSVTGTPCTLSSPGTAKTVGTAHPLGCCPPSWGPLWGEARHPSPCSSPLTPWGHQGHPPPDDTALPLARVGGGRGAWLCVGLHHGKEHVVPLGGR